MTPSSPRAVCTRTWSPSSSGPYPCRLVPRKCPNPSRRQTSYWPPRSASTRPAGQRGAHEHDRRESRGFGRAGRVVHRLGRLHHRGQPGAFAIPPHRSVVAHLPVSRGRPRLPSGRVELVRTRDQRAGITATITHSNVPDGQGDSCRKGWSGELLRAHEALLRPGQQPLHAAVGEAQWPSSYDSPNGSFRRSSDTPSPSPPPTLTGSGSLDLVATDADRGLYWFENDGAGTFTRHVVHLRTNELLERHAVADVDGDGKPEIVCVDNLNGLPAVVRLRRRPEGPPLVAPELHHGGRHPRRLRRGHCRSRRRRRPGRGRLRMAHQQPDRLVREPRRGLGQAPDRRRRAGGAGRVRGRRRWQRTHRPGGHGVEARRGSLVPEPWHLPRLALDEARHRHRAPAHPRSPRRHGRRRGHRPGDGPRFRSSQGRGPGGHPTDRVVRERRQPGQRPVAQARHIRALPRGPSKRRPRTSTATAKSRWWPPHGENPGAWRSSSTAATPEDRGTCRSSRTTGPTPT